MSAKGDVGSLRSVAVSGTEWFILIVIVILLPLAIAVAVTLWTLEMARQRNKRNQGERAVGVKRRATRVESSPEPRRNPEMRREPEPDTPGRR